MKRVVRSDRTRPSQFLHPQADQTAGNMNFALRNKPHRDRSGEPPAGHQSAEDRLSCGGGISVERLWIVSSGILNDLAFGDGVVRRTESVAHANVFQVVLGEMFVTHGLECYPTRVRCQSAAIKTDVGFHGSETGDSLPTVYS